MTIRETQNNTGRSGPTIEDVRRFWDANPLWTGETNQKPGGLEFFEDHRAVYSRDCFAGSMDERIFPNCTLDAPILDLGCGIGFWLVEFWERGFRNMHGADLSPNSLALAKKRCDLYRVEGGLSVQNAENLSFDNARFEHVNCQGVLHHTPDIQAAIREIVRVLRPGGTASISVYYENIIHRNWTIFRPISKVMAAVGAKLIGRGREDIYAQDSTAEIVRRYDGKENPIGRAYSVIEFQKLVTPFFDVDDVFFHFFPARSLPIPMPRSIHAYLDKSLPFMMYYNLRKS